MSNCPSCNKPMTGAGLFLCQRCDWSADCEVTREASRVEAVLELAAAGIDVGNLPVRMTAYRMIDGHITVDLPRDDYALIRNSLLPFQYDCRVSATTATFKFKKLDDKLVRSWNTIFGPCSQPSQPRRP